MNVNKLRGKIVEQGLNVGELAEKVGMDRATLYRKMRDQSFSVKDAHLISSVLSLSEKEVMEIFFTNYVA